MSNKYVTKLVEYRNEIYEMGKVKFNKRTIFEAQSGIFKTSFKFQNHTI